MHKHKKFRHKHQHGWHFGGWFWMIGLWFLFSSGHGVWPGILILIGISMLFGSFFDEEPKPQKSNMDSTPSPDFDEVHASPPTPKPATASIERIQHDSSSLPLTCPQCGGPIRSYEVKWKNNHSAACPYCGSNLKMKK